MNKNKTPRIKQQVNNQSKIHKEYIEKISTKENEIKDLKLKIEQMYSYENLMEEGKDKENKILHIYDQLYNRITTIESRANLPDN